MNDVLIIIGFVLLVVGLYLFVSVAAAVFGLSVICIAAGVILSYIKGRGN
ncbi:hypothetical protein [Eubacterium barkeri]|uniref:Uncharacterized protein n=1 Tax=Eubacterium barkeri TaxID=1528 RepID=A0A1H3BIQ2_EUBBA|nr:hypothetical protein [Eubacterium barkeri]SDX41823.1 hypothetical protein SAMN04488579_10296 [Eubacterium barkeri]